MNLSSSQLARLSEKSGFQANPLEKVLRLVDLLNALRSHPFLKDRVVLKGGTALNLFLFHLPRLSVDIDLNYIGAADRETMLAERPRVEQATRAVCEREGYVVRRMPEEHAGGKWILSYQTVDDRPGTLALEFNFLLRVPLWPIQTLDSLEVGPVRATHIPLLDVHELAAGKLSALLDRTASRDLLDVRNLLRRDDIIPEKLRTAFVVYGGMNRRDLRTACVGDVRTSADEVNRRLIPLLRRDLVPGREELETWTAALAAECRSLLSVVLPMRERELELLDVLNGRGEIASSLLTDDEELQERIASQPGLLWKAQNVRRHIGAEPRDAGSEGA